MSIKKARNKVPDPDNQINRVYCVESRILEDNSLKSVYSEKMEVAIIAKNGTGNAIYTIRRTDVRINGKQAEKLVDRVMEALGDALFPVVMEVSPEKELLTILNFNDIRIRRRLREQELMGLYPSGGLNKYIDDSKWVMDNSETLLYALYRDIFFNLYFLNIYTPTQPDERRRIIIDDFPKPGMNRSYLYSILPFDNGKIVTPGEIMQIIPGFRGEYEMTYRFGGNNEIEEISGSISTIWEGITYVNEIAIKKENE